MITHFLNALGLLTRLPAPARTAQLSAPGKMMAFFPLVGALIGLPLMALALLFSWSGLTTGAPLLAPALVLALWTVLTGGLHLDGWTDCCDALFVPVSRERRLEIMKDPHIGAFGAIGLVLLLLVKFAAIHGVLTAGSSSRPATLLVLLLAPVIARWTLVLGAVSFPLARPDGMAAFFQQGCGGRELLIATLTAALFLALLPVLGLICLPAGALAALLFGSFATGRLGGVTGDVHGATVELVETTVLIAACLAHLIE